MAEEGARETTVHGVLVDVYGIGVLLLGESGTGKSECALDLVTRGHRLVADDVVEVVRESDRILMGRGPSDLRPLLARQKAIGVGKEQLLLGSQMSPLVLDEIAR